MRRYNLIGLLVLSVVNENVKELVVGTLRQRLFKLVTWDNANRLGWRHAQLRQIHFTKLMLGS